MVQQRFDHYRPPRLRHVLVIHGARSLFSFEEVMREIQGRVGVDQDCDMSPEIM